MGSFQKQNCQRETDKERPPDSAIFSWEQNDSSPVSCSLRQQNEPRVELGGSSTAACPVQCHVHSNFSTQLFTPQTHVQV